MITGDDISALLIGAAAGTAAGSAVTYWNMTREKRIVSGVRRSMERYAKFHDLTEEQRRRTQKRGGPTSQEELVSDKEISEYYEWGKQRRRAHARLEISVNPTSLAAEAIICEKLLGLSRDHADRVFHHATVKGAKADDDFKKILHEELTKPPLAEPPPTRLNQGEARE